MANKAMRTYMPFVTWQGKRGSEPRVTREGGRTAPGCESRRPARARVRRAAVPAGRGAERSARVRVRVRVRVRDTTSRTTSLPEVGGARVAVDGGAELVHARQRVHDDHLLLGGAERLRADDVAALHLVVGLPPQEVEC